MSKLEQMQLAEEARWSKLSLGEKVGEILWKIVSAVVGFAWDLFCKEMKKQYKCR